jgi:hypothetical protein
MPRGFKHFATSPTHPHAANRAGLLAAQNAAPREESAAAKELSGCQ